MDSFNFGDRESALILQYLEKVHGDVQVAVARTLQGFSFKVTLEINQSLLVNTGLFFRHWVACQGAAPNLPAYKVCALDHLIDIHSSLLIGNCSEGANPQMQ